MNKSTLERPRLSPEVHSFITRVGAGEKIDANGAWYTGEASKAETGSPRTLTDLLRLREAIRKAAIPYPHGDINAQALRQLLDSVDDSIELLVKTSGNEAAILEYQKMRATYRQEARTLDDPAVVAAQEGRLQDVDRALMDPVSGPESIRALKQTLGQRLWDDFGHNSLARLLREFTGSDGVIAYDGIMSRLSSIDPKTRYEIYGPRGEAFIGNTRNIIMASQQAKEADDALLRADRTRDEALKNLDMERAKQISALEATRDEELRQIKERYSHAAAHANTAPAKSGVAGRLLSLFCKRRDK